MNISSEINLILKAGKDIIGDTLSRYLKGAMLEVPCPLDWFTKQPIGIKSGAK